MKNKVIINFYPLTEVFLFALFTFVFTFSFIYAKANLWCLLLTLLLLYIMVLGRSNIIIIKGVFVKVIYLNPFFRSREFFVKKIIKVESTQKHFLEFNSTVDSVYPNFYRKYTLTFIDKNNEHSSFIFSISNLKKEKIILDYFQKNMFSNLSDLKNSHP